MNVGLPGMGIASLLYIVLALLMPFRLLYRMARRTAIPGEWRSVLRQAGLAAAIVVAVWVTWTALSSLLRGSWGGGRDHGHAAALTTWLVDRNGETVAQVSAVMLTAVAAATLLLLVEIVRLVLGPGSERRIRADRATRQRPPMTPPRRRQPGSLGR